MTPEEATRRFYSHVWPCRATVLRTARFLCGNVADAEDLAQETLLKAFRAMESFDMTTNPQHWLSTILRNTRIDRLRANSRSSAHVPLDDLAADPVDTSHPAASLDPHDPAALLEAFSDARMIDELQELPEDIRWTLLLVDVEQMTYEDASVILDVPPGTVKSRVHRGRQMLRVRLLGTKEATASPERRIP